MSAGLTAAKWVVVGLLGGVLLGVVAIVGAIVADQIWTARKIRRLDLREYNAKFGHLMIDLARHGAAFDWSCRCGTTGTADDVDAALEGHWEHVESRLGSAVGQGRR